MLLAGKRAGKSEHRSRLVCCNHSRRRRQYADWQSTRRVIFMKTDNLQPHFWMLEDIQLRCRLAAEALAQALKIGDEIIDLLESAEEKAFFTVVQHDAAPFSGSVSAMRFIYGRPHRAQLRRNLELKKPSTPGWWPNWEPAGRDVVNSTQRKGVGDEAPVYRRPCELCGQLPASSDALPWREVHLR